MKADKNFESRVLDSRRALCLGAGAALLLSLIGDGALSLVKRRKASRRKSTKKSKKSSKGAVPRQVSSGPISGESLYRDVIAYYNIGEHRTATEADLKTSEWLASELRATGLQTAYQRFKLRQFFPRETKLSLPGTSVRAFPLWPPRATDLPVRASMVRFSKETGPRALNGAIALVRFPYDPRASVSSDSVYAAIIDAASKSGAAAVVAVTEGPADEITALNVEPNASPWPVPVVLVAPRDSSIIDACAKSGAQVSLILAGKDELQAEAKNVIGRLPRGEKLIVVSTPQSGWFRCAAERGPGVALFLGLARWASRRTAGPGFLFLSTSGHELGGLGMRAFQQELAPKPDGVLCWLHLGAGIAAFAWEDTANGPRRLREADSGRLLMASPNLIPIIKETFALTGLTPTSARAVGELDIVLKAGYRTFGIAARHRFHHTPADSPEMTGPEILEPVASALVRTLEAIESGANSR